MQKFDSTARPAYGAAVPVVVALNGFTDREGGFATRQRIHLVDRECLPRRGAGQHRYHALEIECGPGRRTRLPAVITGRPVTSSGAGACLIHGTG
ncbi:hypothetical protein [Kitasatospora sp. NPDC094016]|uniref:hypothetical protein n=1 Tax=Kitasatospora sp. NPDC094016 TaxID=3154986 RepID=UPI0033321EFD